MSSKRTHWLLIATIVVELLTITGLVAWTLTRDQKPLPPTNSNQTTDSGTLTTELIGTNLQSPTNIIATPIKDDARLFITERVGTIKTINKNGNQDPAPFLDITSKVKDNGSEMGLLGLAFHPKFAENGYLYVNYTDKEDNTIIARYHASTDGPADPASEKVLLKIKQPYENHNGGALVFGPDGFLYIALGDGGSAGDPQNRAQNKNEMFGKILRIDVNRGDPYAIPQNNPFTGQNDAKPEIWAWGLRNPWRISFDRETGDLYIADVGQSKLEEVNLQEATSRGGENYGWRCYEGTQPYNLEGCGNASQYKMPAFEYAHEEERCSIAGGYVYHGHNMPSLRNNYIYGDTCSGEIFAAKRTENDQWSTRVLLETGYTISTFGEDHRGELYVADLQSGNIYRLETH